jgi:CarboxypepD_reg-like domain
MRLLLLCLGLLLSPRLLAQTTIVGRVTDLPTGRGIPGVTVLLKGSSNGTLTSLNGTFSIVRTPNDSGSHVLVFSIIGYMTVERPALVADSVRVALSSGTICYGYPDAYLILLGGLRHTQFGARLQGYGHRFNLPLRATIGYQTNFHRNHQTLAQLDWLDLYSGRPGSLSAGLRRATVQQGRRELRFRSYSLVAELDFYRRLPVLLLGLGHARYAAEQQSRRGYGYEIGARRYFGRGRLQVQLQATRWPGYWQWQGEISHHIRGFDAGVLLTSVGRYRELSLSLGRSLP